MRKRKSASRFLRPLTIITGLGLFVLINLAPLSAKDHLHLVYLGQYETGLYDASAAEIVAHDSWNHRLFITNCHDASVDVVDIRDPEQPVLLFSLDCSPYGKVANSVAVHGRWVAAAVENNDAQAPGCVVIFDIHGQYLNHVPVGPMPDMLTFTPNGRRILVANEGEPDARGKNNPPGSVSIIDLSLGVENLSPESVTSLDFSAFDERASDPNMHFAVPGVKPSLDFEPEYIAVSPDGKRAWVGLQESNAIAAVDLERKEVIDLFGLGWKEHRLPRNGLDASNLDGGVRIECRPVYGLYQPDGLAVYACDKGIFLVTANEGDPGRVPEPGEEKRVKDLPLDAAVFSNAAELKKDENLGMLKVSIARGDTNGDGDYDALYSFGGRSFSIFTTRGRLVFDSGDDFERITAERIPEFFNAGNESKADADKRSDDRGPEPEGLCLGKIRDRTYVFIGLEQVGGVMVYDITDPFRPSFETYFNRRALKKSQQPDRDCDLGPEGLCFIPAAENLLRKPLLVVAHEVSGSTAIFEVRVE